MFGPWRAAEGRESSLDWRPQSLYRAYHLRQVRRIEVSARPGETIQRRQQGRHQCRGRIEQHIIGIAHRRTIAALAPGR